MSREALLDLLEGSARYLDGLANAAGERVCPQHGVEHLGKTAYSVHLGLALAKERGAALDVVRDTALHLARHCQKYPHPEARAYLFFHRWPDKWNCSNHLIDSGAACDALGRALIQCPEVFDAAERELVVEALESCAQTYLWAASVDKPVAAQCLWGALGMARASVALGREDLAERARAAIAHAYRSQHSDGSWSYYPSSGEPGSSDASAFYHSRCIGFALEALELIGDDPGDEPHRGNLTRALEFLLALHRADDTKCRAWEAKLWYFEGQAEVASLCFDIHALCLGLRAFGDARYADRANRSLALLLAAQRSDGSIDSGAEESFQCPTFWTAHTGLLASVLDEVATLGETAAPSPKSESAVFEDAGLGRLELGSRVVLVRGRRSRPSPGFGGLCGGGAVVSDCRAGAGELRRRVPFRAREAGEFVVPAAGPGPSRHPARWRLALRWLRFSRWRWRCTGRSRGIRAALDQARRTLGGLRNWCGNEAASHFALDCSMELENTTLRIRGTLALSDGQPLAGTQTDRSIELTERGLWIEDLLTSERSLPRVLYRLPDDAVDLTCDGVPIQTASIDRRFQTRLAVRYRIP